MKVGIVTVYDSANIGSFLQALGMQELVRMHGDTPYMIRTRSKFKTFCIFAEYICAPDENVLKNVCKHIKFTVKHPKLIYERLKKYRNYKRDQEVFDNIISVKQANKMQLDILLLGSDEIWNSNWKAFLNPYLYGIGITASKKYGYAVSVGGMSENNWNRYRELKRGIENLDGIFARDKRTVDILAKYGINVISTICDPTLQCDLKPIVNKDNTNLNYDYIAVYTYGLPKRIEEYVTRFAKENGLKTVAVSLYQGWCDEYINISPLEFAQVLKNAKYVVTSTFHGTIFSTLYKKQFVSYPSTPKVGEITQLLGIQKKSVKKDCDYADFKEAAYDSVDCVAVDERIMRLRNEGFAMYETYIKENV